MTRKMKDSGIEWIGEIPEDWEIRKLKFVANIKSGEGITNTELNENGEYEVYGGNGVIGLCNKYNVEGDKLIIGRVGALCGNVHYIYGRKYISDNALILDLDSKQIYKYYYYLLCGANLRRLNTSNAQPLITGTKVLNLYIPNIDEKSQTNIAKYLDNKCNKIDQTIEKEKVVIEKLKEYKQSVITEAITKGLNPDVKMKDSGVEWIGEIPEHWNCTKLIRLLEMSITDGPHETPELLDNGIPFISAEAIKNNRIDFSKKRGYISKELNYIYSKKYSPKLNDIFMIKSGATTGNVAIVETEEIFNIWSPLAVIRSNNENYYKFIFYSLLSDYFQEQITLSWTYGTQQNLGMRKLEQIIVTYPRFNEQKQIADYLDKKCSAIDKLISNKEKLIEKLTEYKKSLIYECVTGKREVQ